MITITLADVKRKARIRVADFDSDIQALIDESKPVIEGKLDSYDDQDPSVVATVKLGMLEILSGMALKEHANEEDQDDFSIGPLKFGETKQSGTRLQRGKELEQSGWDKLKPYLKTDDYFTFGVM